MHLLSGYFVLPDILFKILFMEQVAYMAIVGSFPFNSFLSGVLSCVGTAVLAGKEEHDLI